MTALDLCRRFLALMSEHDVDGAVALCDPSGAVMLPHLDAPGTIGVEGRAYLTALVSAFPDLRVVVRHAFSSGDTAVVEVMLTGTQAADFMGIVDQEKFVDLEQGWRFTVDGERIAAVRGYWCQNMLYRRLGVKRLDRVTITEEVMA